MGKKHRGSIRKGHQLPNWMEAEVGSLANSHFSSPKKPALSQLISDPRGKRLSYLDARTMYWVFNRAEEPLLDNMDA